MADTDDDDDSSDEPIAITTPPLPPNPRNLTAETGGYDLSGNVARMEADRRRRAVAAITAGAVEPVVVPKPGDQAFDLVGSDLGVDGGQPEILETVVETVNLTDTADANVIRGPWVRKRADVRERSDSLRDDLTLLSTIIVRADDRLGPRGNQPSDPIAVDVKDAVFATVVIGDQAETDIPNEVYLGWARETLERLQAKLSSWLKDMGPEYRKHLARYLAAITGMTLAELVAQIVFKMSVLSALVDRATP